MNAVSIGPLVFSVERLAAVLGLIAFMTAIELFGRRRPDGRALTNWATLGLLVGLVAARAGFVIGHWDSYAEAPLDVFAFWQGGFSWVAGLIGFAAALVAVSRRNAPLLKPMAYSAAAGLVVWIGIGLFGREAPIGRLPETALIDLAGRPVAPAARGGKPLVLNLWATWCPPCRREMPMMMEVAGGIDAVDMLFVNQGESAETIQRYLAETGLEGGRILRDPDGALMRAFEARGLPATYFIDAEGRAQAAHFGEISRAQLHQNIRDLVHDLKGAR